MLELGGGLDLVDEPLGAEHGGELGLEHLDRDLSVVPQVLGEVDRRHAARAELALDAVAVGEGGREALCHVAHEMKCICRISAMKRGSRAEGRRWRPA